MTWEFYAYEPTEVLYDIILDRYLLMDMVLYLKSSWHVIAEGDVPHEGCADPMVDMSTYDYESLNLRDRVKPEE